jgi:hypothetical protein
MINTWLNHASKLLVSSLSNLAYRVRGQKCAYWARALGNTWGVTIAMENEQLKQEVAHLGKVLYDMKGKAKKIQHP